MCNNSKLGKCMKMLVEEYKETNKFRFYVGSVEFLPWAHGDGFHLVVMLRQEHAPRPRRRR